MNKYFDCAGSGELTSSAIVKEGLCFLTSLMVYTDGANDATVILYDNVSATGTIAGQLVVTSTDNYGGRIWQFPRKCKSGIYASISGTGASCIVEYLEVD